MVETEGLNTYRRLTASGQVKASAGKLLGFYVASTTSGTLTLFDNTAGSGTQITGSITPAVGWHALPVNFTIGCFATIGGTALDVTFAYA